MNRLKKPFGSGESVNKDSSGQWGSNSELDSHKIQKSSVAMGAMNGNSSMRSSTGAGKKK